MTSKRANIRAAATGVAAALTLAACGSSSSSSSSASTTAAAGTTSSSAAPAAAPVRSGVVEVAISNYAFHPATITVAAGTKVTFRNHDQTAHTASSTQPAFDTGTVKPGHSVTVVLEKPGSYTYYCQFHAFMRGSVIVK
jgi:plastocyanin